MSRDGNWVVFQNVGDGLATDTNAQCDIYLTHIGSGTYTIASKPNDVTQADSESCLIDTPVISDNGEYVGFFSYASNLVPDDTNEVTVIFVYRR